MTSIPRFREEDFVPPVPPIVASTGIRDTLGDGAAAAAGAVVSYPV